MKITPLLLLLCPFYGLSQTLNAPESVEADETSTTYFVSNAGSGEVLRFFPSGTLQSFATGFTYGPHGLERVGDTLYACDGGRIVLLNTSTGAVINSVNLGAGFLNGITHKGPYLFITDMDNDRIYRFNTKTNAFNIMASLSVSPNGIVYDQLLDRLIFVVWSMSAPIYRLNLADSTTTLLTTTSTGLCDGIAMNCSGEFFVSSWSPNAIRKYTSDFSSSTAVSLTGLNGPADIFFDTNNDSLFVPNMNVNNIKMGNFPSCITSVNNNPNNILLAVYPNPATDGVYIKGSAALDKIELRDLKGALVASYDLNGAYQTHVAVVNLPSGFYEATIYTGQLVEHFKLIKR